MHLYVHILLSCVACFFFFFFQAEDGIRDHCVTGVQTCALPISCPGVDRARHGDSPRENAHEHTSRRFIVASCPQADCPSGLGRGGPGPLPSLRNTKRSLAKVRRAWPRIRLARAGAIESCAGIAVTCNEWAVGEMGVIDPELRRARFP